MIGIKNANAMFNPIMMAMIMTTTKKKMLLTSQFVMA